MTNFDDSYIERYLLNQLSEQEKVNFENKIQVDIMLERKVRAHRKIMQAVVLTARSETKVKIKKITRNWEQYVPELVFENKPVKQSFKQNMQAITDEVIALIAQFFRPYSVSYRNVLPEASTVEEQAYDLYSKKEYQNALPLLEQLPNDNKEAKLMLGNAFLVLEQFETAYLHFEKLIEEKPIGYVSEAHWYAGLALLQLHRIAEAKTHFQKILIDDYAGKKMKNGANEILMELKN